MGDLGHRLTDKQLAELEKRIARIYREVGKELQGTINDYFEGFQKRDEEMKGLIGTVQNGKEWTEQDYKQWRLNQMARGERYIALRDKIAKRMTDANEVAVAYTNDATPGIYSLNRNYAAYTIERVSPNADFTLWDEQAVKRLIVEEPNLMPYYPKKRALQRGIDLAYGKKQITAGVTSAILQGKSIKGIADDLQERITTMNRTSAIRTARTAVTGAQNAGRMDSYVAAEKMGIKLKREWLATLDNRTRHAHAMLDGQQAEMGKPFKVDGYEIMFPGDTSAPAYLVYNCRCTLIAAVEGVDTSDALRRDKDGLLPDMTFAQWEASKRGYSAEPISKIHDEPVKQSTNQVASAQKSDIIKEKADKGGAGVQTIGKINVEKYKKVVNGTIRSDNLVLTENQKEHIIKRRGKEFYDKYNSYFADIAKDPDYIFADEAHENTALASKTIIADGKNIHLVIRLAVVGDEDGIENSIITAIVENEKRYHQRLRNKIPLYKKE